MIEVRQPTLAEVTTVVKMCRRLHAGSAWSFLSFSPAKLRTNLLRIMDQQHTELFVAFDDGEPVGILVGMIDAPIYSNMRYAVDVEYIADRGGAELEAAFHRWAEKMRACVIVMGNSSGGDDAVMDRLYRMRGYNRVGGVYRKELRSEQGC